MTRAHETASRNIALSFTASRENRIYLWADLHHIPKTMEFQQTNSVTSGQRNLAPPAMVLTLSGREGIMDKGVCPGSRLRR